MKIEELIIDGFKSYATRTVISQWDSSFNCITGLNGSGKSNILDAICFVLGITTMNVVRAQNLQDLIYKRGQAGVTKASVTIIFDNGDKSKSPIGFEDQSHISVTRQVVMGGTSKYLINGHRAQQTTVQQLFQSVQLNVNNPNFLIMQGRITKVLNMKPTEILALIEEAAGTRMFEERREKAIKTMAKKEKKVEEINALLQEEVLPKLEKLRTEKRQFIEYQQVQNQLERATKLVVSHDYVEISETLKQMSASFSSTTSHSNALKKLVEKSHLEIDSLNQQIFDIKQQREEEAKRVGSLEGLEKKVKDLSEEKARLKAHGDLQSSNLKQLEQSLSKILSTIEKLESEKKKYSEDGVGEYEVSYNKANAELQALISERDKKEELLQSLQTGVASKEGQASGYGNEIQQIRDQAMNAETSKTNSYARLESISNDIKNDQDKTLNAQRELSKLSKDLEQRKSQLQSLESQLAQQGFVPGRLDQLSAREKELKSQIHSLNQQIDFSKRRVANIDFKFKPPNGFDTSSVKGVVAQLFSLEEKNYEAATALEVAAGGKLYQVVVDTDTTATQIIKHGQLKRRVTIIPLNRVSALGFAKVSQKLGAAQKIAPGKVDIALNLIGYDHEVERAMQYVFGNALICSDNESARKVAFHPQIRVKTVTLDGDIYDPRGTLSGGSDRNKGNQESFLISLQKINDMVKQQRELVNELRSIRMEIQQESNLFSQNKELKVQFDLKTHEMQLLEKKLNDGPAAKILQLNQKRQSQIKELEEEIAKADETISKCAKEIKKLEKEMKEFKTNKSGKLKELQDVVTQLRHQVARKTLEVQEKKARLQEFQMGSQQYEGELQSAQEESAMLQKSIAELQAELSELEEKYMQIDEKEKKAMSKYEEEKSRFLGLDQELNSLEKTLNTKQKFLSENKLQLQKATHELGKLEHDIKSLQNKFNKLVETYEWVSTEAQFFGQEGSPYNFYEVSNMSLLREELAKLNQRSHGMKKSLNEKVMNTLERMENKEETLHKMITTIEKDKRKIEETIVQLDDYKRKALEKTWVQVSEDLGKIFGDLLPGSTSKLVTLENRSVTEGLEVKVALGGVWKDSLTELSGGQRSLVALSLIMALLQFKPAPMYILDEVDAALDLNHTQNIGQIIKTRFKGAQFIVVSLKEGMFTNANRIFRTRFTEGTSTVTVS